MKWSLITLSLVAATAEAEIFRCDTPDGPVFSDSRCSDEAVVVNVEIDTSGISIGPSDEVRQELEQKKAQRAEDREQARKLQASQPPQPVYVPAPAEQPIVYPGVWPRRSGYRPYPRPPRPQPKLEQRTRKPLLPDSGGSLLQPQKY